MGDLVRASGRPEVKSLWAKPQRDKNFMRAVNTHRVMTVIQNPVSKKSDYGRVGFHKDPHASYFVFPRQLAAAEDARVVGINYELLEEP